MNRYKRILAKLTAHLPHRLPQGITEFETWAKSIVDTYEMPDNDSVRFGLAVAIMHLPATASHKPKAYFGAILLKGAASQIAGAVMQDLKEKQKAQAELAAKEAAEPTETVTAHAPSKTP